jgi:hypothetical protein
MVDAFISHASKDSAFTAKMAHSLQADGLTVWGFVMGRSCAMKFSQRYEAARHDLEMILRFKSAPVNNQSPIHERSSRARPVG